MYLKGFVLIASLYSLVMAGCSTVSSSEPVGQGIDHEEIAQYNGIWKAEDGVLYVQATTGSRAKAAWVEWDDNEYKLTQIDLVIGEIGSARYVNMMAPEEENDPFAVANESGETQEEPPVYFFFRLIPGDGDTCVLYPPSGEAFRNAVTDGHLEGKVDGPNSGEVHITSAAQTLADFLDPDQIGTQFEMDAPLILTRIGS